MRVVLSLSDDQDRTVEEATEAEALGFDAVSCSEHLFFHGPTSNAFVTLAAAAGATRNLRLVSTLTILPIYPAALAIKLATTLDRVSGGRFELGVGVGGEYPAEFAAVGIDLERRGARTDEALELARLLWSDQVVNLSGDDFEIDALRLSPPPMQRGGPPIWVGGRSDAAMRRAGRYADIWLPYMYTPEQLATSLTRVREHAEKAGRDPATIRGAIYCWGAVDGHGPTARAAAIGGVSEVYQRDFTELADRYLLLGTPDQVTTRAAEYRDAGADTLVFAPTHGAARARSIELFAAHVVPELRGS